MNKRSVTKHEIEKAAKAPHLGIQAQVPCICQSRIRGFGDFDGDLDSVVMILR